MLISFAAKALGKSHIEKSLPCQDAADASVDLNGTIGVAIVADGHGGSKHFRSQKGSELAVKFAKNALLASYGEMRRVGTAFFNQADSEKLKSKEIHESLKQLEGNIIYQWRREVLNAITNSHLAEEEKERCTTSGIDFTENSNLIVLYGTTLLAALVSDSFWFAIQIGDGLCMAFKQDGTVIASIPEDNRLAFGRTTSLCDSDAIENFRESFGLETIQGITVATDGVTDSFEHEKYIQFNRELYEKFAHFPDTAAKDLEEFLPKLSDRGSGDDVAIAGLFRVESNRIEEK